MAVRTAKQMAEKEQEGRAFMEFYATRTGRRFFESQLPSLIQALEGVTEALNRRQVPVTIPAQAGDDFLKELFYGNVEIGVSSMEGYSDEKLKEVTLIQDELKKELNEEQWELFETCSRKMSSCTSAENCRMFQHGFRLAVKLIAAGLGTSE